ncbi:MAG: RNB domain-containing ribonuclease [Patulibacter minatonensis]
MSRRGGPGGPRKGGKGAGPRKNSGRHGGRGSGSTQGRRARDDDFAPRPGDRFASADRGARSDRGPRSERPRPGDRDSQQGGSGDAGVRRGLRLRVDGGRVCLITRQGRYLVADPFFGPGRREVVGRGGAHEGELALLVPDGPSGPPQIVERLGDPDVTRDVLAALLRERDYKPEHEPAVLRAASEAVRAADPAGAQRRDLTAVPTFTIDPTTAKDFDDAISATELDDGRVQILVHIADVTSFVLPGDPIDRAGRDRATSTYIPGLVAPMLPPQLADDACSLVPGAERRAVTVDMIVRDGRCLRAEVYRTMIRSDARLTYDEVDEVFEGRRPSQEPWAEPLRVAREVAADLLARRKQALELDIPEPEFTFDPDGRVTSQRESSHTESHRLIEQLMVLANEQVARILQSAGAPGMFRIHEQPEAKSAERLVEQLASLGIPTPAVPDEIAPAQAAEIVVACSKIVADAVKRAGRGHLAIPILVLRALKVASYSPANHGHAGLGLTHYCHFTSPIRRYPDIVCHRAVLALAEQGRAEIGEAREGDGPGRGAGFDDDDPLAELARHCSDQERASMGVEREADRIAKAYLLRDMLRRPEGHERVFRGEVTGIIPAGLFVNFGGGFDGMIPLRALRGDWWEVGEEGTALFASSSGAVIRLGDPCEVQVERLDEVRGRVDLRPLAIGGDL